MACTNNAHAFFLYITKKCLKCSVQSRGEGRQLREGYPPFPSVSIPDIHTTYMYLFQRNNSFRDGGTMSY